MSQVFTQAANFGSAVSGGVDPRTGLFGVTIALGHLVGNRGLGPSLPLELGYSPLTRVDIGFGLGVSMGLTVYDTENRLLVLSAGGQHMVQETDTKVVLLQNRLDTVHILKERDAYRVVHKSGSVEILTGPGNASALKVPTVVLTPDGHRATLTWDFTGPRPRLTGIRDEHDTLLTVDYAGTSKTILNVLPGHDEGYRVDLGFSDGLLGCLRHFGPGPNAPLVWSFENTPTGPDGAWGAWITGVTMPGGMWESVHYRDDGQGHRFPDTATMPPLPYVHRHVQAPGGGQPMIETSYDFTDTNFLGGHSNEAWDDDQDDLYNILTGYTYGSTEERVCDGRTTRVTRAYDNFHLQTQETTEQNGCSRRVGTEYYAVVGQSFDRQKPQFQLPKKTTVTWKNAGDTLPRVDVTEAAFDEHGNPTRQCDPDGTVTTWDYYPSQGSGDDCPREPNGFTRLLKSVTRTPLQTGGFDAPSHTTIHRYVGHDTPDPVCGVVLHAEERHWAGDELLTSRTFAYETSAGDEFGRLVNTVEIEHAGESGDTYAATHAFTFTLLPGATGEAALVRTHTLTTHDGQAVTCRQTHSPFTGRQWSATDTQGNVTSVVYDNLGRPLTVTTNPDTPPYQAVTMREYAVGGRDAPFTQTTTDVLGNRVRATFDGAARQIRCERLDVDGDKQWHPVRTLRYDSFGRLAEVLAQDHVLTKADVNVTRTLTYDDWGQAAITTRGDGECRESVMDPVARTVTTRRLDPRGANPITGNVVTLHNERDEPVRMDRYDLRGTDVGERTLERDGWGRVRRATDEQGNVSAYTYDTRGRVTCTTLPDGTNITRSYAPFSSDALTIGITVNGASHGTQVLDGLGRTISTTSGGRTWCHIYPPDHYAPLPASTIPPEGPQRFYTYIPQLGNALSRVTAGVLTRNLTHDPVSGLLTGATEGENVSVAHDHWPSGRLRAETTTLDDRSRGWTEQGHSVGGLTRGWNASDGAAQSITRDPFGRVSRIEDPAMEASPTYDDAARLTGWTTRDNASGHTLTTRLAFDDLGREMTRVITDQPGDTSWTVAQSWLADDLLGRRVLTRGDTTLRDEKFTYTNRNQLKTYACSGTAFPRDAQGRDVTDQHFTYDVYGNVTTCVTTFADGTDDTATYWFGNPNDPCQLTRIDHAPPAATPATIELGYDGVGRLTKDDAGRELAYDSLGRLTKIGSVSAYGYDPLDRLLTQTADKTTSVFCYRDGNLAHVAEGEDGTRLLRLGGTCVAQHHDGPGSEETRLLGTDGKGSVILAATGTQLEERAYTAYGSRPVGATASVLGYDGERADPAVGWLHLGNGYRPYHPGLMRFTAPDSLSPFGAGGINPYAYCLGDPINRIDPSGHLSWQAWLQIGIGVLALAASVVTGGASIVAATGAIATITTVSATTLGVVSATTAIAGGALEKANPNASAVLGWVSLGTGLAEIGLMGGAAVGRAIGAAARPCAGRVPQEWIEMTTFRQTEPDAASRPARDMWRTPEDVLFTQTSTGSRRGLRESFHKGAWNREFDPIDTVEHGEGSYASLDNRRVASLREVNARRLENGLGRHQLEMRVHEPSEYLPSSMRGSNPRFGFAKTWGEAVQYRISQQDVYSAVRGTAGFDISTVEPFTDLPQEVRTMTLERALMERKKPLLPRLFR